MFSSFLLNGQKRSVSNVRDNVYSENAPNEAVYEPISVVVFETVNMTHSIMPRQYS